MFSKVDFVIPKGSKYITIELNNNNQVLHKKQIPLKITPDVYTLLDNKFNKNN